MRAGGDYGKASAELDARCKGHERHAESGKEGHFTVGDIRAESLYIIIGIRQMAAWKLNGKGVKTTEEKCC